MERSDLPQERQDRARHRGVQSRMRSSISGAVRSSASTPGRRDGTARQAHQRRAAAFEPRRNDREGGGDLDQRPAQRKTKHAPKPPAAMHPEFAAALDKAPQAKSTLDSFPPSAQREYLEWIAEAKQEATRQKRIADALEWLARRQAAELEIRELLADVIRSAGPNRVCSSPSTRESAAFVEALGARVRDDRQRQPPPAGLMDRRVDQRPSDPVTPQVRFDEQPVELARRPPPRSRRSRRRSRRRSPARSRSGLPADRSHRGERGAGRDIPAARAKPAAADPRARHAPPAGRAEESGCQRDLT